METTRAGTVLLAFALASALPGWLEAGVASAVAAARQHPGLEASGRRALYAAAAAVAGATGLLVVALVTKDSGTSTACGSWGRPGSSWTGGWPGHAAAGSRRS